MTRQRLRRGRLKKTEGGPWETLLLTTKSWSHEALRWSRFPARVVHIAGAEISLACSHLAVRSLLSLFARARRRHLREPWWSSAGPNPDLKEFFRTETFSDCRKSQRMIAHAAEGGPNPENRPDSMGFRDTIGLS